MGSLFTWLTGVTVVSRQSVAFLNSPTTGSPRITATLGSPVRPSASSLPVLVFSHGLAACRTSYSFLATDLASQGMVRSGGHDMTLCCRWWLASSMGTGRPVPGRWEGGGWVLIRCLQVQETEGGKVRWEAQVLGPEVETYQVIPPDLALVLTGDRKGTGR